MRIPIAPVKEMMHETEWRFNCPDCGKTHTIKLNNAKMSNAWTVFYNAMSQQLRFSFGLEPEYLPVVFNKTTKKTMVNDNGTFKNTEDM